MIVYIESVILDNMLMTATICFLTFKILRQKVDYWSILIVSSIGTTFAIMLPLINIPNVLLLFVKLFIGIVLGYILGFSLKKKLLCVFLFFVSTFLLGGVVFGLTYLQTGDISSALNKPLSPIPLWALILIVFFVSFVFLRLIGIIHKKRDIDTFERQAEVFVGDRSIKLNGFVDTGNRLYYFDKPLSIINYDKIKDILDKTTINAITSGSEQKGVKYIEVDTLNGRNKLVVIKSPKIVLYDDKTTNIFYEMMIAITSKNISEYDMILPPAFV